MSEDSPTNSGLYHTFYPDHTFSSKFHKKNPVPIESMNSLNNSYQVNESLPEIILRNDSPIKIKENLCDYPLKLILNQSKKSGINISLKSNPLRKSLQNDTKIKQKHKPDTVASERMKAKSVQGINKKRSDEIPATYRIPKNIRLINPACKEEERLATPCFSKRKDDHIDQLKDLCEKLLIEQEQIRNKIKYQQVIITKLNKSAAKNVGINKSILPIIAKVKHRKFNTQQKDRQIESPEICEDNARDPVSSYSPIDFKSSSSVNSPKLTSAHPINEYPLMIFKKLDKIGLAPKVPHKYYKDQPKVRQVFRFPKEVFTPK